MTFIMGSNAFSVASRSALKRLKGVLEPMGFITTGGEFRDGPPATPTPPPPSRYETFAKIDDDLTKNMSGGNTIFSSPPPPPPPSPPSEPTGMGRDNYRCDVFDKVTENILPVYARAVLNKMIGKLLGSDLQIDLHLVKLPEVDGLTRVALSGATEGIYGYRKQKIGRVASWCLPYVICLGIPQTSNAATERQTSSAGPQVVQDYVAETEEKFIRVLIPIFSINMLMITIKILNIIRT
jgi:hypothetical protein